MNDERMTGRGARGAGAFAQDASDVFDNGLLRVEHDNYYVSLGGRPLRLPRKEFLVVSRLARNFDRVVASEEIWRYAWGEAAPLNSESLHVHIYRLRRRLEPGGLRVDTMVNVGYRLTRARAPPGTPRRAPARTFERACSHSGAVQTDVTRSL